MGWVGAGMPHGPASQATLSVGNKFPKNIVSKLSHYSDIQIAAREILDCSEEGHMTMDKMWRRLVFLYLGCGGCCLQPWRLLKDDPRVSHYDRQKP